MSSLAPSQWRHICPVAALMPLTQEAKQHGPDAAPAQANPTSSAFWPASSLPTLRAGRLAFQQSFFHYSDLH
jgi:hypothetical protein